MAQSAYARDVDDTIADGVDDLLRLFLQKGFRTCFHGHFPYTGSMFSCSPGLTYIYIKAHVETCDIATCGNDLFRLLEQVLDHGKFLLSMSSELPLTLDRWEATGFPNVAGFLQTLIDRGLQSPRGINLLSFYLSNTSGTPAGQDVRLLTTMLATEHCSPLRTCPEYGHPLDLLAQMPEAYRWHYADILLNDDTLAQILDNQLLVEPLDLFVSPWIADLHGCSADTNYVHDLRRCVLHVLTRLAFEKLPLLPERPRPRFQEIL